MDQPQPVDGLQHLGLAGLLDHGLDAPIGVDPDPLRLPVPVEQGQSRMSKTPKASGPGQSGDLDYCARGGAGSLRPSLFSSGLSGARLRGRQRARNRHPRNGQH